TNVAGSAPIINGADSIFNGFAGLIIGVDGSNNPFASDERNVINGSIVVTGNTVIAGNYIGVNASGTATLSNVVVSGGIQFDNPTAGARIGTNGDGFVDDAERNVISGFNGPGI